MALSPWARNACGSLASQSSKIIHCQHHNGDKSFLANEPSDNKPPASCWHPHIIIPSLFAFADAFAFELLAIAVSNQLALYAESGKFSLHRLMANQVCV